MQCQRIAESLAVICLPTVLPKKTEAPICPEEMRLAVKTFLVGGILSRIHLVVENLVRQPLLKEKVDMLELRIAF